MMWLEGQKMSHASHQEVFVDYLNEVKRAKERIELLEKSIDAGIARAPKHLQELIAALQSLARRGEDRRSHAGHGGRSIQSVRERAPAHGLRRRRAERALQRRVDSSRLDLEDGQRANAPRRWRSRVVLPASTVANGPALKKRQEGQDEDVKAIAWKAQHRLHQRFQKLSAQGKHHGRVVTAISRELLGFVWAIGRAIEAQTRRRRIERRTLRNVPDGPAASGRTHPRGEPSSHLCGTASA